MARKFEYYEKERESLRIIIRKMNKIPKDVLQDDDLRKLLSVMPAACRMRCRSTTLNPIRIPQTVTGRLVGWHDVVAVRRHHRRFMSRDVRLGRLPDAAEEEMGLIKSISIWNWNVQHRVKVPSTQLQRQPAWNPTRQAQRASPIQPAS